MLSSLSRLSLLALIVFTMLVLLPATVQAQTAGGRPYLGPYSVYNQNLTGLRPAYVYVPTTTQFGIQTTVTVPDRGQVLVGGYSRVSESRNEFGVPGLGKVPYVGRGFNNVGTGRDVKTVQVIAGVRIINLYEEEERQTGVRSGR
jgi:Flp pilus assembly secretin CpaC